MNDVRNDYRASRCDAWTDTRPCCAHADELIRRIWRTCARSPRNAATAAVITSTRSSPIAAGTGTGGAARRGGGVGRLGRGPGLERRHARREFAQDGADVVERLPQF